MKISAVKALDVVKNYDNKPVLKKLSVTFNASEAVGLLGPNGAGKTTFLRIVAGLVKPDYGNVFIKTNEAELSSNSVACRRLIGYVGHSSALYGGMSAYENLALSAKLFGIDNERRRIRSCLSQLNADSLTKPVNALSNGQKKRVSIARALLHKPPILLLDEPDSGLDFPLIETLKGLIKSLVLEGVCVVFISHNASFVSSLANKVVAIKDGKIEGVHANSKEVTEKLFREFS